MATQAQTTRRVEELRFDNSTLRRLPVARLPTTTPLLLSLPVATPRALSTWRPHTRAQDDPEAKRYLQQRQADTIELDPAETQRDDFAAFFCGNKLLPGAEPAAHCYCGYQFGYFSGQLGDGATMYLGEVINSRGERWEIQFKGAGKTPFSRTADGRKVLRSSVREFLASEAMHALGVPTTRAGTLVSSDTRVERDVFYSGNPIMERACVVLRIAPTFLRFGSFEIFKPTDNTTGRTGPSAGLEEEMLPGMINFVVDNYFPELAAAHGAGDVAARAEGFLREAAERTAELVAAWQAVGWAHGVLNTDNMSILGLTIDYGPYGFLDRYDPATICNGSDKEGRYVYGAQPAICKWNLERLADALAPVLPRERGAAAVARYDGAFARAYARRFRAKLGLATERAEDEALVEDLLSVMEATGADFTNTFRRLALVPAPAEAAAAGGAWRERLLSALAAEAATPAELARSSAPRVRPDQMPVLLQLAKTSPDMLSQLGLSPEFVEEEVARQARHARLRATSAEAKAAADRAAWGAWLERYQQRLAAESVGGAARRDAMRRANPKYILRNYIADTAIAAAEEGDFSEVARVLARLQDPFGLSDPPEETEEAAADAAVARAAAARGGEGDEGAPVCRKPESVRARVLPYDAPPPRWAGDLCVTCSS